MRPASWSLRSRTVALTAVVLTVLLSAASLALVLALRSSLTGSAVEGGLLRAEELAVLVEQDRLPTPLPGSDDDVLVQVVGGGGAVLAASAGAPATAALDLPASAPGRVQVHELDALPGAGSGPYRVVGLGTRSGGRPATVFVAVSLEDVRETVGLATWLLAGAVPALVALLSAGAWVLVGRTLHPVAVMTAQARGISPRELHRRLPEPGRDDELGRLARTLNAMLARLEDGAQRQRRFVADAAHELRSPVSALRAQLETAELGDPALTRDLLAETVRLQELTEELLLLARMDGSGAALRPVSVDLDDVVDRALARALRLDGVRPGAVRVDASGVQPAQVAGEPRVLERVVDNLLSNAVRHARSVVRVRTRAVPDGAELTVEDDGPGVPEADRQRVLLPFTRLDDARTREVGGAGLGLTVVRDACRAHGGSVEVSGSELGGALVRVRLPSPPPVGRP